MQTVRHTQGVAGTVWDGVSQEQLPSRHALCFGLAAALRGART